MAERLLAVIDEGRRTATYKLALLIALIDCCAENTTAAGAAPQTLSTRTIARHMARLYWPQLRPFPTPSGALDLRQITSKSASILSALEAVRTAVGGQTRTWDAAAASAPDAAAQALDAVELTVARYPIVRLQTIDAVPQPFLYDIDWGEGVTLRQLRRPGGGLLRFRTGAGDELIRLTPLIRPLVELHWVRMVAALNKLTPVEDDLRRHLFGAERSAFPMPLRRQLRVLQDGRCFYCPDALAATADVDHFLPWSRWPNDAIENLVLAHTACNGHKSDRVPGPRPLERWALRLHHQGDDLRSAALAANWESCRPRTLALARSLYAHLTDGSPVWNAPHAIVPSQRRELGALLTAIVP